MKPNFLIVGAAKSGTTSLHHYLSTHPDVFMPQHKEPMFFVSEIYRSISRDDPRHAIADKYVISEFDKYLNLFADSESTLVRGEASTAYLYHYKTAISNIKKYLGDIKIIIILRNPVERAFSSYVHLIRDSAESVNFEKFLEMEEERKQSNWDILNYPKSLGLYSQQIEAYKKAFTHVKFVLLDELKANSQKVTHEIYTFLDISPEAADYTSTSKIHNKSSAPRSKTLHNLIHNPPKAVIFTKNLLAIILPKGYLHHLKNKISKNNRKQLKMNDKTRKKLEVFFREDILKTQKLINKDLSHWLVND